MEDMGGGMIQHRGVAPLAIDLELDARPLAKSPASPRSKRPTCTIEPSALRVSDTSRGRPSRFRLRRGRRPARRPRGKRGSRRRRFQPSPSLPRPRAFPIRPRNCDSRRTVIRAGAEADFRRDGLVLARGAPALALLVHQTLEAVTSTSIPSSAVVLGQIERKSISIVEFERDLARQTCPRRSS